MHNALRALFMGHLEYMSMMDVQHQVRDSISNWPRRTDQQLVQWRGTRRARAMLFMWWGGRTAVNFVDLVHNG